MAESKNIFIKSKMNKDLDDRLLPQGEYRDALNIQISKSEGEDVGALENVLGNKSVVDFQSELELGSEQIYCIGYLVSEERSSIYFFLTTNEGSNYDPNAKNFIVSVNSNNNTIYSTTKLVQGAFLNFSTQNPIHGVNLLENLLFFTDNRNQPRKINVDIAAENIGHYVTEDDISVAKYNPYLAPKLYQACETFRNDRNTVVSGYETTMKDVFSEFTAGGTNPYYNQLYKGDPDYLEEKFVRFSYRFKYEDGEYSLFAPFTQEAFIPKQDGYFLFDENLDDANEDNDQSNTFKSTVVDFMENKVNEITLLIPMPSVADPALPQTTLNNVTDQFKITEVEILYKESDGLPVYVVDTLDVSKIKDQFYSFYLSYRGQGYSVETGVETLGGSGTGMTVDVLATDGSGITSIRINSNGSGYQEGDVVEIVNDPDAPQDQKATIVIKNVNTLEYVYSGTKPFRTLPEDQLIRVYDKVPVKAFGQEVVSNRIIYSNFQTKHSPPPDFKYNVGVDAKKAFNITEENPTKHTTSLVEYPSSTLKQNRNYQVGFVFSDRFGRTTSTVLSNNAEGVGESNLSTVYSRYNDEQVDIGQWLGDALVVDVNSLLPLTDPNDPYYPGLYNGDPASGDYNPLGLYSWKIVVKQQEQDYYNVYLPGIMASYPEKNEQWDRYSEIDTTSHVVLLNDNINKVPRDLNEVGPDQKQYRSSVKLFCRVENTDIEIVTPGGLSISNVTNTQNTTAVNFGSSNQQFYPGVEVDSVSTISTYKEYFDNPEQIPASSNPTTPASGYEYTQLYQWESNPLIAKISTSRKTGQTSDTNPSSAPTQGGYPLTTNQILGGVQYLAVYETEATESRLDIYYETSSSGTVEDLNEAVEEDLGQTIRYLRNFRYDFDESFGIYSGDPDFPEADACENIPSNNSSVISGQAPIGGLFYFEDAATNPLVNTQVIRFIVKDKVSPPNILADWSWNDGNPVDAVDPPKFKLIKIDGVANNGPGFYTDKDGNQLPSSPNSFNSFYVANNSYQYYTTERAGQNLLDFIFEIHAEDLDNPIPDKIKTFIINNNILGNVNTSITNCPPFNTSGVRQLVVEYGYTDPIYTFTGTNGANPRGPDFDPDNCTEPTNPLDQIGLEWSIDSQPTGNLFQIDIATGELTETNPGTATGVNPLVIRCTGPDATFDTCSFNLVIGETPVNGGFASRSEVQLTKNQAAIVSVHTNQTNFAEGIGVTQYPEAILNNVFEQVEWNDTIFNTQCGSDTKAESGTPVQTLQHQSFGEALGEGTGFIKIKMLLDGSDSTGFLSGTPNLEYGFNVDVDFRATSTDPWIKAVDIEGNALSENPNAGSNPDIINPNSILNSKVVISTGGAQALTGPTYGYLTNTYGPTSGLTVVSRQLDPSASHYGQATLTVYAAVDAPGEYRVSASNLGINSAVSDAKVIGCNKAGEDYPENPNIPAIDLVNTSISVGDFYYDILGPDIRACEYIINIEGKSTRDEAEKDLNKTSTTTIPVYAREPLPRYVTQFYFDVNLNTPAVLNTDNGTYFAYKGSDAPASGSQSPMGENTVGGAEISEAAATCNNLNGSNACLIGDPSSDRQFDRIWSARFNSSGLKTSGTAEPKFA